MSLSDLRESFRAFVEKSRRGFFGRLFNSRREREALLAWGGQLLEVVERQQRTLGAFNETLIEHERRTVEQSAQIAALQGGLAAWEELRQPLRTLGAQVGALTAHATAVQSELSRLGTLSRQTSDRLDAHREQSVAAQREVQAAMDREMSGLVQRLGTALEETGASLERISGQLASQASGHDELTAAWRESVEASRSQLARAEATLAQLATQLGRVDASIALEFAQFQHQQHRVEEDLARQTAAQAGLVRELQATADFSRNLAAHADASLLRIKDEVGKMTAARQEVAALQETVTKKFGPQVEATRTRLGEVDAELKRHDGRVTRLYQDRGPDDPEMFARFYLAFENQFRGSPEEIAAKGRPYLPALKKAAALAGPRTWVDLGCGRGEWLEQLAAFKLDAVGVDTNTSMLQVCRERGLKVVEADALDYVQKLPADSLLGASAFHLIEHLPYRTLLALMNALARAIKPGGCLILETPNPQNVSVGACNFYMDLTHQKPIPPMTAEFLVRHAGFREVKVLPLNPFDRHAERDKLPTVTDREYCQMFYGPRDYGVVAFK
jgi:O-antigen chain-terminating methyltransferase